MKTNTQFQLIRDAFTAFNNPEATPIQRNMLAQMCNFLNSIDKTARANGGKPYKVAEPLDETSSNPFYEVELPPVPEAAKLQRQVKNDLVKSPLEVLASVNLDEALSLNVSTDLFTFDMLNSNVVAGTIEFKEGVPMSLKLAWAEKHLV